MIVRFFRSDAMSERLGEVDDHIVAFENEFVQLTYTSLRDFDGNDIAWLKGGEWHVDVGVQIVRFSDIVIAGDDSPIGEP